MSSTKRGGIPPERIVKRLRPSTNENEQPTSLPPEVWAGVMECKLYIYAIICKSKLFMPLYNRLYFGFVYEMTLL